MDDNDNIWEKLGRPRFIVAPMVDASELAWRMLCRNHQAELCYSPMYHSSVFVKDTRYQKESLATCPGDRPLIIQFCGNKPDVLVQAGKIAEPFCDAIDINLGCPQAIAKRGHYGAFLQDDWELLKEIVSTMNRELRVPVTCKVRVFDDKSKTISYAQMLESAGCKMITVHGRTREQKGPLTGLADWNLIKAVRESVNIPVIANGNIQCVNDVERCLEETGCSGVMTAEGNLTNPFLFEGVYPPAWEPSLEYLDLVEEHPCPNSYVRGHLFKMLHRLLAMKENAEIREEIAKSSSLGEFRSAVIKLKAKYLPFHEGEQIWEASKDYNLELPPWLCQPYVRPPPEEYKRKMETLAHQQQEAAKEASTKRELESSSPAPLSKKKLKKLQKKESTHSRRVFDICSSCPNPAGLKCDYTLCKVCCKSKCYTEELDCPGHRILIKANRQKARQILIEKVR